MSITNNNTTKYFDLTTTGIGYVNRIRKVKPTKGNPYFALTIAALMGKSDEVSYTYLDCMVTGQKATEIFKEHSFI